MQLTQQGILSGSQINSGVFSKTPLALDEQLGIVLMGQSNAVGTNNAGPPTPALQAAIHGAFIWNSTGFVQTLDWGVNDLGNQTGPELSLCRDLQLEYDRNVYLLKYAVSGAPLFDDATLNDFNIHTAELYPVLRDRCLNLMSIIQAIGKVPKLVMVVIQGERDTLTNTTAAAWYNNFNDIVDRLRQDGVNFHAIVLNTLSTAQDLDPSNRAAVIANQQKYIRLHANTFGIDMTPYGFEADNIHFSEAAQETIGSDIASIIINDIFDGSESVSGYSAEATAVLNNFPPLPTAYADAIADYVDAEQTAGNWDNIIEIQCRAMDTATNALIGWKGVNNAVVMVGGTHIPGTGWEYDGVDDWIDTRFRPTWDSPLWTQNNAAFGWYVVDNQDTTGSETLGGVLITSTTHRISLGQSPGTTQTFWRINQIGGSNNGVGFFSDNTLYEPRRTASNASALMVNGVSAGTSSTVSAGIPTGTIAEGCLNNNTVPQDFFDGIIGAFFVIDPNGFNWTTHNTNVQALMAALAAI